MSIYTKLLEIQKKHLAFEKDAKNPFFKSNYVSLDSIVEKLTPLLDEQKILCIHYTENKEVVTKIIDTEAKNDEVNIEVYHNDSIYSRFPLIESNDPQKLWSCITYAKRYNLAQIFNIITDRDDDWNEASWNDEKKEVKKEEIKRYNDVDKNIDKWEELIFEWKLTPQEIIDNIWIKWYKLNKDNREKILNLNK